MQKIHTQYSTVMQDGTTPAVDSINNSNSTVKIQAMPTPERNVSKIVST